jgi:hypothetical protein
MDIDRAIRKKFRVKRNDILPFKGFRGTRDTLAQFFGEVGFNHGAEIGVREGVYSEILCKFNPDLKLISIDPWCSYGRSTTQETADRRYKEAVERLTPFGVDIRKQTSMDAVTSIQDGSLDFVYIDGMHDFDNVMKDLIHWAPKVRRGGIVSGHDYHFAFEQGIVPAVNAYTYAHNISLLYITKDRHSSFFWVKK